MATMCVSLLVATRKTEQCTVTTKQSQNEISW